MIPMPIKELSGFSVSRDGLAAICVNDNEPTEGAKIFTLFHEYCHVLLRQTGISDENDSDQVEWYCNRFAASFLVPLADLKNAIAELLGDIEIPYEFSDANVKRLAVSFRVSNRAVALRLERTGLAPERFYRRRTGPWDLPNPPVQVSSPRQPSPIRIHIKRNGRLHTRTVLEAVNKHVINSFDASELIGLRPATFKAVEAALE
jgi:Zn-dependent peptidase ImmA (M78 family)